MSETQCRCHASHPHHQKGWASWKCPACGSALYRDLVATDASEDCSRLHSDDQIACTAKNCQFAGLGNYVSRLVATTGHNHLCDKCKGRGHRGNVPCEKCSARGYVVVIFKKTKKIEEGEPQVGP